MPAKSGKKPAVSRKAKSKAVTVENRSSSKMKGTKLWIFIAAFAIIGGIATLLVTHAASQQGPIKSALGANICLDDASNKVANGNKIQLWGCNGTNAQKWTVKDNGTIVNANGYCLDVVSAGKAPKTLVQLWSCNGTVAQKWTVKSDTSIVNPNSGLCMDAQYSGTKDGTQVWLWPCNNTNAQKWTVPANATGATTPPTTAAPTLFDASKKEIAMELVSSAENSSLNWKAQYAYIEDINDGRGYTGGIIGFCSGSGDMLQVVEYYNQIAPNNGLTKYIAALKKVNGTPSHTGLGTAFEAAWKTAAKDPKFQEAQNYERDKVYFNPAVNQAISDGVHTLGQFIYYDAMVMHGPGTDAASFGGIRAAALKKAKTPAQGGNETTYLNAFLDVRKAAMKAEADHSETSRVDTEQRVFLNNGNLNLNVPLTWKVYGDPYSITKNP